MKIEEVSMCSLCGKPIKEILILTEVLMDIHSRYHREDDTFENMNGLRKQTQEFFCEDCTQFFIDKITALATEHSNHQSNV